MNWRASVAGNLYFLTQFIRFQSLWSFKTISWILLLKKSLLIFLTISLNDFKFLNNLKVLYSLSLAWHSLFYYSLEYLVILIYLECLYQIVFDVFEYSWTMYSGVSLSGMNVVSRLSIELINSIIKFFSSLLSLIIVQHLSWMNFSLIVMSMIREVWLEEYQSLGRML